MPAIVEEPTSNGCGTASCVVATNEYICSGDCLDEYTLSGNEESLWAAIDDHACAGASISEAVRAKWMPFCDNTPPIGCPLKDVSSLAIRQGEGLDIGYHNAHQIQIHVDGGIELDSDNCEDASSYNATWALAVVAVDELMQGKSMVHLEDTLLLIRRLTFI